MARRTRGPGGNFLPAHLQHQAAGKSRHGTTRAVHGLLLQGVVIKVYKPGDTELARRRSQSNTDAPTVTCDVYVYTIPYVTILRDVPIIRQSAGLVDSDVWIPRAASIDVEQLDLVLDGEGPGGAPISNVSEPANMDGDHVIVGFLGSSFSQAVILGQIDHPKNIKNPVQGDSFKRRISIRGWQITVTDDGNLIVDGSAANGGVISPNPVADPPTVPVSGNITLQLAPGTKVSIEDSTASSPQQVLRGSEFLTDVDAAFTEIAALLTGLGAPPAPGGPLAILQGKIATSLSVGPPYLANHLDTD